MQQGEYEGKQDQVRALVMPKLEVVKNVYPDKDYEVSYITDEFNSVCPKTGLPDFAKVTIKYRPDIYLVEMKSLKLYMVAYRNVGIFQEHATNKILDDFVNACKPRYAEVISEFSPRGGTATIVKAEYKPKQE